MQSIVDLFDFFQSCQNIISNSITSCRGMAIHLCSPQSRLMISRWQITCRGQIVERIKEIAKKSGNISRLLIPSFARITVSSKVDDTPQRDCCLVPLIEELALHKPL